MLTAGVACFTACFGLLRAAGVYFGALHDPRLKKCHSHRSRWIFGHYDRVANNGFSFAAPFARNCFLAVWILGGTVGPATRKLAFSLHAGSWTVGIYLNLR